MRNLLIFTGLLSLLLGVFQLFFPQMLSDFEKHVKRALSVGESMEFSFRRVSGVILLIVGVVLFYLAFKYNFIS